jgi:hypothetical protein
MVIGDLQLVSGALAADTRQSTIFHFQFSTFDSQLMQKGHLTRHADVLVSVQVSDTTKASQVTNAGSRKITNRTEPKPEIQTVNNPNSPSGSGPKTK